ncbi:MAG: hypothetical protein ACI9P5_003492 [Saprospiraceae bacterium]|jgi:hypothetical protein
MDTLLLVKNFTLSQTRDFYEVATFALLTLFLQKNAGLPISAPGLKTGLQIYIFF